MYEERRPQRVLEIGSAAGVSLYYWLTRSVTGALVGSIDITAPALPVESFVPPDVRLLVRRASSHSEETLGWVTEHFVGLDWLFIDGDHTYEGVKQDWEMYSPLLRPGGLAVFHDIFVANALSCNVRRFWIELKTQLDCTWEIGLPGDLGYGLVEARRSRP